MASATVLYVLQTAGNLAGALPQLGSALDQVKSKAAAAASSVGTGLGAGIASARKALDGFREETEKALEGVAKIGGSLVLLAYGVNQVLAANRDWQESTARLGIALTRMQKQVADTFGKPTGHYLDMFTLGLVYLANLATRVLPAAFDAASRALNAFVHDEGLDVLLYLATGQWQKALNAYFTPKTDSDALIKALQEDYQKVLDGQTAALEEAKKAWVRLTDGISDVKGKKSPYEGKGVFGSGLAGTFEGVLNRGGYRGSLDTGLGALGPLILPLEKSLIPLADIAAELPGLSAMFEQFTKQLAIQGAADALTGFGAAASGGLAGVATAYGGPIGALVGAVLGLADHLPDLITSLVGEAFSLIVGLPDLIGQIIGTVLPGVLTDQIPQIIATFPLLTTEIGFALLQSIPSLVAALIELIPLATFYFIKALRDMADQLFSGDFWAGLGKTLSAGVSAGLGDLWHGFDDLGIHLGKASAGHRSLFGIHIPKLDDGGVITRTGLAMVHAGEQYLGAPGSRTAQRTGGTTIVMQRVYLQDIRALGDQLRRARGQYGIGLRIDPLAGSSR